MSKLQPPLLAQLLRDKAYKDAGLSANVMGYMLQAADQLDSLYNHLHPRATAEVVRKSHKDNHGGTPC